MNLIGRLFGKDSAVPIDAARWIVLDVETTGLDMRHDELLAIAAVALIVQPGAAPRIDIADSFEVVLQRTSLSTDKHNILLHGIGVGAQRAGAPAAEALTAFARYAGASPLVAFHAAFDRSMIGRAMQRALGRGLPNPWLDLAPVAAALHPQAKAVALDDWLQHFRIECAVRHQAAADTLATAELLLRLWPAAQARQCTSFEQLREWDRHQRWLRHT
jgi:DNA polymerase III subunit epsilon